MGLSRCVPGGGPADGTQEGSRAGGERGGRQGGCRDTSGTIPEVFLVGVPGRDTWLVVVMRLMGEGMGGVEILVGLFPSRDRTPAWPHSL